jgi:hypothetical protein
MWLGIHTPVLEADAENDLSNFGYVCQNVMFCVTLRRIVSHATDKIDVSVNVSVIFHHPHDGVRVAVF